MITFDMIKPYLDPDDLMLEEGEEFLQQYEAVLEGTVGFAEQYLNRPIHTYPTPPLLLVVSKLFRYNIMHRPHLTDMRTEDMRLIFSDDYPPSLLRDLHTYRKVTW